MPIETTLDQIPVGGEADVVRVGGHKAVKRRLMEMGLVRGERVRVQRVAPLGDPIELRVKGYDLALRRSEASAIVVSFDGEARA
ncbi:MAG: ferrous iron transport protein A [Anaerolineae bacterium]